MWAVIARALVSWFSFGQGTPAFNFLMRVTEPLIEPIRRHVPRLGGMIDLSPIVVIFALILMQSAILNLQDL